MALEGTLEDMSLTDLFQVFQMGEKSGVLLLLNGDLRGSIHVRSGRLIDAAVMARNAPRAHATGKAAIMQLMQWRQATFSFTHDPSVVAHQATIQHAGDWLILESHRQQRDAHPCARAAEITCDTLVEPSGIASSPEIGMGLEIDQWRIMDYVVRSISVAAIARGLRIAPDTIIQHVHELVITGLLQVAAPPRATLQPALAVGGGMPAAPRRSQPIGSMLLRAIQRRVRGL